MNDQQREAAQSPSNPLLIIAGAGTGKTNALARRAVQWPARAALTNLAPTPDDSHTSLTWDTIMAALLGQPLKGGARVGLRVAVHELVFTKGERTESFAMAGKSDADAGAWLDTKHA